MKLKDTLSYLKYKKELNIVYGSTITSWDKVKTWDDVVPNEKKALIDDLKDEFKEQGCPLLKKLDNYFYFCESRAKRIEGENIKFTDKPALNSAQYNSQPDHFSLQLLCFQHERHKLCIDFELQKNN